MNLFISFFYSIKSQVSKSNVFSIKPCERNIKLKKRREVRCESRDNTSQSEAEERDNNEINQKV